MTVLRDRVREAMERHWRPAGYTVPNDTRYPYRWLWDSCFHAVIWVELGDADRAVGELRHLFRRQDELGFVPHIDYGDEPGPHAALWGRPGSSSITQPPMYGWAVAELRRRGVSVPDELVDRATRGLRFFLAHRRHRSGLIAPVHPWETGCDDSPRWDHWGAADPAGWYTVKGDLVATIERSPSGAPLANPAFDCGSAALTALVAFNLIEMGDVAAEDLVDAVAARWDADARTWTDAGPSDGTSGRSRTLEAMLPLLTATRPEALADVADPAAFAGPFGPRGVHPDEATYEPGRYWRGGVWPPLAYLLWVATNSRGDPESAASLASSTIAGAEESGLAEYWDPETGVAGGSVPHSWAGVVLLMS